MPAGVAVTPQYMHSKALLVFFLLFHQLYGVKIYIARKNGLARSCYTLPTYLGTVLSEPRDWVRAPF
jgi:hypothetical protein